MGWEDREVKVRRGELLEVLRKNRERHIQDYKDACAGYREQALKLYPWICTRCGREFTARRLRELTVHHKDHNHDNNPADGSNWELLCVYCHDNEHQRQLDQAGNRAGRTEGSPQATHTPFADLASLLKKGD